MPRKTTSSSKTMAKKGNKQTPVESEETSILGFKSSSESSGEEYNATSSKRITNKGKVLIKTKGKKTTPQDFDTPPPKGPWRNNAIVSPPYTLVPLDIDEDEDESSSTEKSTEEVHGPKVDVTLIAR